MKKILMLLTLLGLASTVSTQDFQLDKEGKLIISGVLLEKRDGFYIVRIEGGTTMLPVNSVVKVTKNSLSLKDIRRLEAQKRQTQDEAEIARQVWLAEQRIKMAENRARQRIKDEERKVEMRRRALYNKHYSPRRVPLRYYPIMPRRYYHQCYNPVIRSNVRVIQKSTSRCR
jgi:hypothetical protein